MHFLLKNRAVAMLLGTAFVLIVAFLVGFFVFIQYINSSHKQKMPSADGIVVLTGGPERIEQAVKLLSQGKGKRLLISGVHPSTSRKDLSRLVPRHKVMFKCCIDIDNARDTIGNATLTKDWVLQRGFGSIIVVTASYHMPRSMVELRRTMPSVELIPFPVAVNNVHVDAWWSYPGTMWLLTKEYCKTIPALVRLGVSQAVYYVSS